LGGRFTFQEVYLLGLAHDEVSTPKEAIFSYQIQMHISRVLSLRNNSPSFSRISFYKKSENYQSRGMSFVLMNKVKRHKVFPD
jgi:hypothetical protein